LKGLHEEATLNLRQVVISLLMQIV